MLKRILVPTDGSAASMAAVDAAVDLAHACGAEVVGLHVRPLRPLFSEVLGVLTAPEAEEKARECLAYVERRAAQAGVGATLSTRRADSPADAIVAAARDLHCDLIVMGSRGRGQASALLLGSQTQGVLAHSAIPVMVVRQARGAAGS
jgi:nucleotide-binding universal stress UspA family protein